MSAWFLVEGADEPVELVAEDDGTFDLSLFDIPPRSILLNGKANLVDKVTGFTKRNFERMQTLFNDSESGVSMQTAIQVKRHRAPQAASTQPGPSAHQQLTLSIVNDILWRLFCFDDDNATATSVPGFKANLLTAYSMRREGLAFCMLTHKYLPTSTVIGAHLWKRRWARFCSLIGITDIDDLRNGLLLFKPLEWAFDNSKLSIVPDTSVSPPMFQVYVQDGSLRNVRLVDQAERLQGERSFQMTNEELEYVRQVLGNMTFGDVHKGILRSDTGQPPNPYTRVLDFQYRRALAHARENNWPQPEDPPPPSHSSPGDWHVQRMFDSMEAEGSL